MAGGQVPEAEIAAQEEVTDPVNTADDQQMFQLQNFSGGSLLVVARCRAG